MPLYHTPDAILAHPRFADARKVYVREILGLYENNTFLNQLFTEVARAVVFFNTICLHCACNENDRATWPTLKLLQETLQLYGIASPRRVEDIVRRFVVTGYIQSTPAPRDRRARLLTPTAKALAHDRDYLRAYHTPLDVLFPEPGYGLPLNGDPAFQAVQRAIGKSFITYAAQLMAHNPAVMFFMGRDAAMMVLIKLVQLRDEGDGVSSGPISFADLADRFGISRTHVRETLREAAREGLLRISDQGIVLSEPLLAGFDRFMADTLAGMDLMFRLAMRQLEGAA